jgi:hypothetical protein
LSTTAPPMAMMTAATQAATKLRMVISPGFHSQ